MWNKKILSIITLVGLSVQTLSVGAYELALVDEANEGGILDEIIQEYNLDTQTIQQKGVFGIQSLNSKSGNPKSLTQSQRENVLLHNINKYGKSELKKQVEKHGKNVDQKKGLEVLKDSLKDEKNYNLIVETSLSEGELKTVFDYFENNNSIIITPMFDEYKSSFYELEIPKNSQVGKLFSADLEKGILPENLFGRIDFLEPELYTTEEFSTGFYQGETSIPWGITKIGADKYQYTLSKREKVKVGILDTGIALTHKDLQPNLYKNQNEIAGNGIDDDFNGYIDDIYGYDFITNTGTITDVHGHGTHVAGTVGAAINGLGIYGVNSNVELVALKVLSDQGYGSSYAISRGIRYAADNGIKVINLSLGSQGTPSESNIMCSAITYALSKGTLSIAAAGNNNVEASGFVPAGCANAFAVGAIDSSNKKASFSNYGSRIDISAPGVGIRSTLNNGSYGNKSGTSMAAPHVAGAVAAVLAGTGVTIQQAKEALIQHSDEINSTTYMARALHLEKAMIALGVPNDTQADGINNPEPNPNTPPTLELTQGQMGINSYQITANASDVDGEIVKYDFFVENELVQSGLNKTYSLEITKNTTLSVKVYDNSGDFAEKSINLIYVDFVAPSMEMRISQTSNGGKNDYIAQINYNPGSNQIQGVQYEFLIDGERKQLSRESTFAFSLTKTSEITGKVISEGGILEKKEIVKYVDENILPTLELQKEQIGINTYKITANAQDSDGFISNISFIQGDRVIQSGTGNIFEMTITQNTFLSVTAYDNMQGSVTKNIELNLTKNTAPVARISVKNLGKNKFIITPTATDKENNIVSHSIFIDGVEFASSTGSNIEIFEQTITQNTKIEYFVKDSGNLEGKRSTTLTYRNILPKISLTNKRPTPNNYELAASATDENGQVVKLQLFEGETLIKEVDGNTLDYQRSVTQTVVLKVVATDNEGGMSSRNVTLTYRNILPKISLTNKRPTPNNYELAASATDDNGQIVKLQLFEGETLIKEVDGNTLDYQRSVTQTVVLKVVATDNEGGISSRNVTLTYRNILPKISLTNKRPTPNNYELAASATDENGQVVKLQLFEGETLIKEVDGNTLDYQRSVTQTVVLKVVATDNEGGMSSRNVTLTYRNILPKISLTNKRPTPNNYELAASATDDNGQIVKLQLFEGENLIKEVDGNTFDYQRSVTQTVVLKVVATDNEGGISSRNVTLTYRK